MPTQSRRNANLSGDSGSLVDFANAHRYFGMHRTDDGGWVFREWAPNATGITLIGDFSRWKEMAKYRLKSKGNGVWEIRMKPDAVKHGDLYKMMVHWPGGDGERIPAYADRVVQDEKTAIFSAQVWAPERPYAWKVKRFRPSTRRCSSTSAT